MAGGPALGFGVHVPSLIHPLFCPLNPAAYRYTFFEPTNVPLKLRETLSARLLPDVSTELDPAFSVHWLLEAVPATPGVSAGVTHAMPALLSRYKWFPCGW